ncbi:hypothetical protein UA08_08199 [Talaromyces atroroseus]|uniref:Peptidase A1 domain-containing protein n=1 Tax=Talaromyces atroroseus TaxID=1441469 RepID=A0A225AC93_TALAT|nr:hypothetical protein UA08_08199 [Talaromyces atroroseus]OKL56473.1 hypothetical protein UA08_08199 [Talaromyces atroroseus]
MPSKTGLALFGLAASALAEPQVLHMPLTRNPNANRLAKRNGDALVDITNDLSEGLYYVNASVGTPGQEIQLTLDTGSSDIWFFGANSCDENTTDCFGGTYNPSKSSSVTVLNPKGAFSIQYGTAGSNVTGNYITDDFSVGAASVKNLTMAYATYAAYVPTGVMGIGFDTNEAITDEYGSPYPNFVDVLVSQNVTKTKAYSLWLNDLDSSTGNILFGGYDTKKFSGELLTVDIQPDEMSGEITSMTVAWTSLNVTANSKTTQVTKSDFTSPALLDSGTTITIVPDDIYYALFEYFQAESDGEGDAIVKCSLLDSSDGTLDFGFGGTGGPVVKVPFSELALPATDTNGNWLAFEDGELACVLGLEGTDDGEMPVIFGDTFLRSAYVVYDLTNKQISLAQTVFNATDSNIVEISSSSPVASVVTGVTVTQTATNNPLGQATATAASSTPTDSSGSSINSIGVLSSSTSTATSAASTSSHGSAASIPAPVPGLMTSLLVAGASMMFGSVFFMLH